MPPAEDEREERSEQTPRAERSFFFPLLPSSMTCHSVKASIIWSDFDDLQQRSTEDLAIMRSPTCFLDPSANSLLDVPARLMIDLSHS